MCRKWQRISSDKLLWRDIDLSPYVCEWTNKSLIRFVRKRFPDDLHSLCLTGTITIGISALCACFCDYLCDRCRNVRDTSAPVPKCPTDTSAPVPKCPDTSALVPKCLDAEVSVHPPRYPRLWERNVFNRHCPTVRYVPRSAMQTRSG